MPLIPACRRQRQEDLCEFKASLVYIVSTRPNGTKRRPSLKKEKEKIQFLLGFCLRMIFVEYRSQVGKNRTT